MKMINRARSWMCQLCNKKEKGKEKKYIQAFKQLCNLFHASKSANAN